MSNETRNNGNNGRINLAKGIAHGIFGRGQQLGISKGRVGQDAGIPCIKGDARFRSTLPFRQRIAVAIAGIELELALAGLSVIILRFLPANTVVAMLLNKLAWLLYLRSLMHLSPLSSALFMWCSISFRSRSIA